MYLFLTPVRTLMGKWWTSLEGNKWIFIVHTQNILLSNHKLSKVGFSKGSLYKILNLQPQLKTDGFVKVSHN